MTRVIRPYEDQDMNDVLIAWEEASALAHPFLEADFIDQERSNIPDIHLPNGETWVCEQSGRVIGFITLIGNEVGGLFVRPKFHGIGAGRELMDTANALHDCLDVEVFEDNSIGRAFYKKYGFQPIGTSIHEETGNSVLHLKYDSSCRSQST